MQTIQKNLSGKLYLSINYRSKLQKEKSFRFKCTFKFKKETLK